MKAIGAYDDVEKAKESRKVREYLIVELLEVAREAHSFSVLCVFTVSNVDGIYTIYPKIESALPF